MPPLTKPSRHERLIPAAWRIVPSRPGSGLEVLVAQRVDALGPLLALPDDAGLAQDLEVVGSRSTS
jgi:hypothetical protein